MFSFNAFRKSPRVTHSLMASVLAAVSLLAAGCSSEAGSPKEASSQASTPSAQRQIVQASGSLVQSSPINSLTGQAVRQRLFSVPRPAEVVASTYAELGEALLYAERAASADPKRQNGGKWIEAAQIGLLFGSPEGKAFLAAPAGRALVRGEPSESCPILKVAAARSDKQATEGAMRSCLREISKYTDCGCRVIARADRLLAKRDDFQYAIGVSSRMVDPSTGRHLQMTAEERIIEGRPGVRRLWMLGINGPVGMLQIERDGRAVFIFSATGKRYNGTYQSDGFRRGRAARRAYLTADDGKRLIMLIGFEDSEIKENIDKLMAWNPYGQIDLKKAAAN